MDEIWVASDIAPQEITYLVRIKLANAFDQRAVRNELRRFRRPFLPRAFAQFALGARNEHDATKLAAAVERLASIRSAVPIRLNRFRQWLIRQRLAGNYAGESGDWFYYPGDGDEDG